MARPRGFPIDFHTFQMVIAWYCILVYIMAICTYIYIIYINMCIIIYIEWSPHHFPLSHGFPHFPLIFLCLPIGFPIFSHHFPDLSSVAGTGRGFVPGDCLAGKLSDFTKGVISPAKNGDFTGKNGESTKVNHSEAYPLVMSTVCYWTWPSRNSWFTQLEHGDFP